MRRTVVLWVLLMVEKLANGKELRPLCRSSSSREQCKEGHPLGEKFYFQVNGYQVIAKFSNSEKFELWCNSFERNAVIPINNLSLPAMNGWVTVEEIEIRGCTVPSSGSYVEALKAMNVNTTRRLFLRDLPAEPKLERHHLQGLEISELEIAANDSSSPPNPKDDYLEDILKLRSLKLKSIVSKPEALMHLPTTLEDLEINNAELPTADLALSNGGTWLKRLQSLITLHLTESQNGRINKTSSITLPKLDALSKLINLSLYNMPLNPISLPDSLTNSSIKNLVLISCGLNKLPKSVFEGVNLTSLILKNNHLSGPEPFDVLSSLQWLTSLDLSGNELSGAELVRMLSPLAHAQLKILKVNDNPLGTLCDDRHSGSAKSESGLPKTLHELELRGTGATRICSDWIENDALTSIYLKNNSIGNLTYNDLKMKRTSHKAEPVRIDLTNNPYLRSVKVSDADIQQCRNEVLPSTKNSNDRTRARVKLELDSLACDCNAYWLREALRNCLLDVKDDVKCLPERQTPTEAMLLTNEFNDLLCPYDEICLPECSCWKRPSDNATVVRCSGALPLNPQWPPSAPGWPLALHVEGNTLAAVPRGTLVELYAANNNIASLEEMVIDDKLITLDVRNNNIEHISRETAKKLRGVRSNRSVLLAGNRFTCSCSDASAFEFLRELVLDWNETQCVDNSLVWKKTESELCSSILMPALMGLGLTILLMLILGLLVLKHKSQGRKFMFKHNLCLCCILRPIDRANDTDKTHDVFLSYAHDDLDRLLELRSGLENRGYSVIDHIRDWEPGVQITDHITRSVLCSRRTVLFVSDNYAKSEWTLKEFYIAHAHAMKRRTARVLIVRYNLSEPEKLPSDLQLYLKYNTYLDWNDERFWEKLHHFMPPPRYDINHR